VNPDLAWKVPIVVTNPSPSTVHAGQWLGFVYVPDECVGGPGMCNEIDLFGMVCKVGVEESEPTAGDKIQFKDKVQCLICSHSICY